MFIMTHNPPFKKATALLQGRIRSTRLPGKVLLPLMGKPAMLHIYERICFCRRIDHIIVATSTESVDDPIANMFEDLGVRVFRGSEIDPLDRFHQAVEHYNLDHVVRIMGDCPLVDPEVVDEVIDTYFNGGHDFCHLTGEFPVGLDVTVYSRQTLLRCWQEARGVLEREHIFPYIVQHPDIFDIGSFSKHQGLRHLRWTMDHEIDYRFMSAVYENLYKPGKLFLTKDVLALLEREPMLAEINTGIFRDEGMQKAAAKDLLIRSAGKIG